MGFSATVYKVLIASPGDVTAERRAVEDAIKWWNATHSTSRQIMLQPMTWEIDATPEMGDDPQSLLNTQFVNDCDILIGVFWSRLGTSTPRASSGTVEEINGIVSRGRPALVYFSKRDVPQSQLHDGQEFGRVQQFKAECQEKGIYKEFDTTDGLSNLVQNHLSRVIEKLSASGSPEGESSESSSRMPPEIDRLKAEADAFREKVNAPDHSDEESEIDDDDVGILDLSEFAFTALAKSGALLKEIHELVAGIGDRMIHHTDLINEAKASGDASDPRKSKKLVNAAAKDLDVFGQTLATKSDTMRKEYALFIDSVTKAVAIAAESGMTREQRHEFQDLIAVTATFVPGIEEAREGVRAMRMSIQNLPKMTTGLNRAKRVATTALEDLDSRMGDISRRTRDLNVTVSKFLEQQDDTDEAE